MPLPDPSSTKPQPTTSKEMHQEGKETSTNNQFQVLHMEEGEIPSSKIRFAKVEEEENSGVASSIPSSPRIERIEKALEGSTTPGGS